MKIVNKLKVLTQEVQEVADMGLEYFSELYGLEPTEKNKLDVIAGLTLKIKENLEDLR